MVLLMDWCSGFKRSKTPLHVWSPARPHIACSPAVALASSSPTSSVQVGRASVQRAAPQCLTDHCQLVATAGRRQLQSSVAVTRHGPIHASVIVRLELPDVCGTLCRLAFRQPYLSLGQFWRALKTHFFWLSAGPSDFLLLGADHKWSYLLTLLTFSEYVSHGTELWYKDMWNNGTTVLHEAATKKQQQSAPIPKHTDYYWPVSRLRWRVWLDLCDTGSQTWWEPAEFNHWCVCSLTVDEKW